MATAESDYRIAALLTALGPEVTETVLATLPDEQTAQIRDMLDEFRDELWDEVELDEVVSDFMRFFRFALAQADADEASAGDDEFGDSRWTAAPDGSASSSPARPVRVFEPSDDPVADLGRLAPYQIAGALVHESPRTIALVLNCLSPRQAGLVLQHLPEPARGPAFLALRQPPTAPIPLLHRVVRKTVEKGNGLDPSVLADPAVLNNRRIADVLRVMGQSERVQMITVLDETDPEAASAIKRMLYLFEDLRRVHDRSVQKILAEVDAATLAMALKGASQEMQSKIFNNTSKRARGTMQEEMEFLGAVKPSDQAAAREAIAELMARLDEIGELQMD
jgi:flagellar motor switch protein FliG